MEKQELRKQAVEMLGQLVERYPNLRIGQIIAHGLGDSHDLFYVPDEDILRFMNQLMVMYTQYEAAGSRRLIS